MTASRYTRVGDFTDDEANNKGGRSTVVTATLDAELDAVKTVTDDHATRLDTLLRADFKMVDGILVGHEFSSSALDYLKTALGANAAFAWKGTWASGTAYVTGNMVESGGSTYIAVKDSAANQYATFTDALNDGAFQLMASKGATGTVSGTAGNLAGFDSAGQLSDLGIAATDKADKLVPSAAGNVAELDAAGNLQDSGIKLDTKADKLVPTAAGNLAELDASGNLQDSGTTVTAIHAVMPSAHGVLAPHKNLRITRPSTSTVNITADELVATNPSNDLKVLIKSVNQTPDITNSADRDGALAGGWWYLWVATDGTNVHAFFSQSSDAATATDPSGYAYKALVGAIWEDTTNGITLFEQTNDRVLWGLDFAAVGSTTSTTPVAVNISGQVAPIAVSGLVQVAVVTPTTAGQYAAYVRPKSGFAVSATVTALSTGASQSSAVINNIPLPDPSTVYLYVSSSSATGQLFVKGFSFS